MQSANGCPPRETRGRFARSRLPVLALALFVSAVNPARALDPTTKLHAAQTFPQPQQPQSQPEPPAEMNPSPLTPKQRRALLKDNYAKMKQDANQLAALAKSLQDDLNKSNENVLSLGVVEKADKIEKLAKKIKSAAVQ